ncbi:VOC family protein [Hoyosella rhizosphaerae]|uniref:Glyoxalase n=1 Tax=Hoyosella rhizosphaerae TaxID=1755582 RepID=A0A916XEL0_9ACTN|nr:VOC family protein [Hoyosella rhizosphaerae]MBN4925758.1 VOC family protein [Hoyosella rhizosphaerae]GGC68199.1 glyoxalase [Hoyosella rhizosphaerae]
MSGSNGSENSGASADATVRKYPRITPYLTVDGADAAIAYYRDVFGAEEHMRLVGPGGLVLHVELRIADGAIMLADENPEWGTQGPKALGGTAVTLAISVDDVDETVARAVEKGATVAMPVSDQFYGDRVGIVEDPFGHLWHIATPVEQLSDEEMRRRFDDLFTE